ncbi:MAG TPA: DUF898 domain-containing protein [Janthinobacterium sp.]|nr:DUF898 domain-containing protein [Janthinobacterium sp.]
MADLAELTLHDIEVSAPKRTWQEAEATDARAGSGPGARLSSTENAPQRFVFTGSGAEYFRIWVVNLLLTILTLGIYSAWAKVRRMQYFYRNTRVAGAIFDYHGNPKAILKGRAIALGLLLAYKVASGMSPLAALPFALLFCAIMPFLLARSFRFKLINSSYRGLRFRFAGSVADAYRALSLLPIMLAIVGFVLWSVLTSFSRNPGVGTVVVMLLAVVIVLAMIPLAHFQLKRYQHDKAYFGQTPIFFHAGVGDFFKIYGRAVGCLFLGGVSAKAFALMTGKIFLLLQATAFGWLFTMLYAPLSAYASYLFVSPYIQSRIQNLVWNQTELGMNRFESTVSARHLLWIHASNVFLIVLTLGLYKPFGAIRLLKYRVESMCLLPESDLESFLTDQAGDNAGALGQEAGDVFDMDIAL